MATRRFLQCFVLVLLISTACLSYQLSHDASDNIFHMAEPENCNQIFVNQSFGILTSPYYPIGYPDNTNCIWKIKMEELSRVVLTIKSFSLGPGDRLEIDDSGASSKYSFENPPNDVVFSSSNELTVRLKSQVAKAKVSDSTISGLRENRTFHAVFEKEGCGGLLTKNTGYITVPSYIHFSHASHECSWTVITAPNKVITLQFLQFDLPPGSCLYNNIYIREGARVGGYVLGDFCEENPPFNELRSSSNVVYISYRARPNFLLENMNMLPMVKMFYKTSEACGGNLNGFSGSFAMPRRWLDEVYSCNWTITVPHEKQISIKFLELQFLNSTENEFDELRFILPNKKIMIWNSTDLSPPHSIMIPSSKVTISIRSHRIKTSNTKIVFHGTFQAINSLEKQCLDVGPKRVFMCDEWNYVDCSAKCNGVADCENSLDEHDCPITILGKSIVMRHHNLNPHHSFNFSVIIFAIAGILMVGIVISLTFSKLIETRRVSRRLKNTANTFASTYPNVEPPPYVEFDRYSASSRATSPPPAYEILSDGEYSEDLSILEGVTSQNFCIKDFTSDESDFESDNTSMSEEEGLKTDGVGNEDQQSVSTESTELFFDSSSDVYTESTSSLLLESVTDEDE